jgi:hypothetical protein
MKHLTLNAKGTKYTYATGTTGNITEVEVYYSKGGANFFVGGSDRRGIYVSVSPVEIIDYGTREDGSHRTARGYGLMSGIKAHVLTLTRQNDKKLAEIAALLDELAPESARLFEAGDKHTAVNCSW